MLSITLSTLSRRLAVSASLYSSSGNLDGIDFSPIRVGRCIYCGATTYAPGSKRPLAGEHIIPFGLNGNLVLLEASCQDCERITGNMESKWLKGSLLACRTFLGLQTRNPKDRPKALPLFDNGTTPPRKFMIPEEEYPACLYLLAFDTPLLLVPEGEPPPPNMGAFNYMFRNTTGLLARKYGIQSATLPMIDTNSFVRAIAKIGYAYIVRQAREDTFTPIITDFIRGREPFEAYRKYVGGELKKSEPTDPKTLHELSSEIVGVNDQIYVVARIRLFSYLGAPEYRVVVGTTTDPAMQMLQAAP